MSWSPSASRPFSAEESHHPPTQEDLENQAFEQDKFEATGLQLKGSRTQLNVLEILIRNAQSPQATESAAPVQPKLTVGQPEDHSEQEADRPDEQEMKWSAPPSTDPPPAVQPSLQPPTSGGGPPAGVSCPDWFSHAPQRPPRTNPFQAKVTIGQPNDPYEQEADRVAEQVMSMAPPATPNVQRQTEEEEEIQTKPLAETITPLIQRQELSEDEEPIQAKCEACEQEEQVQRSPDGTLQAQPDLESRLNASKGGGSALPGEVRSFMEPRFGVDFSQVRVHTDSTAIQMSSDINAQAFTHKQDIYFGSGKSPGNDTLTAHELAHVVQQTGRVQLKSSEAAITYSPLAIQRTTGGSRDLSSSRFMKDPDLEACYDDEARLTVDGKGKPGTRKIQTGSGVKKVKEALRELGYLEEAADENYTQKTWDAVKRLKKDKELGWEDMGDVGPGTMAWLDKRFSGPTPPNPTPPNPTPPNPTPPNPTPPNPTNNFPDCKDEQIPSLKFAVTQALSGLDAAISKLSIRPLTSPVQDALWLAFRSTSVATADSVKDKLIAIRSGLPSLAVECEQPGSFVYDKACPPGEGLGYTRLGTMVSGIGNIHICMGMWESLSPTQQVLVVIHESSHRFNLTLDHGYFSSTCLESSETAGDPPHVRLGNADCVACVVHFLANTFGGLSTRAKKYRGTGLMLFQTSKGDIDVASKNIRKPRFFVDSKSEDGFIFPASGFKYRWLVVDDRSNRYLMRAANSSDIPLDFGDITETVIPLKSRALLSSRGVTNAEVHCRVLIPEVGEQLLTLPVTFKL